MLLHDGQELDDDFGRRLQKHLPLSPLLSIEHVLQCIVENTDSHHRNPFFLFTQHIIITHPFLTIPPNLKSPSPLFLTTKTQNGRTVWETKLLTNSVAAAADLSSLHSSLQTNFRSSTKCKKERRPVDVPKQQPSMQARRRRSSSSAREAAAATGQTSGVKRSAFAQRSCK